MKKWDLSFKTRGVKALTITLVILLIGGIYLYKNHFSPKQPTQAVQHSSEKLPRLVDLGSDTCVPCKMMAPILDELKREYEGRIIIEIIDVYKEKDRLKEFTNIRAIPTQILYDAEGREIGRHEGFISKEALIEAFKKAGIE